MHGEQKLSSAEAPSKLLFGGDLPLDKISEADLVAAVTSSGQQVIELTRNDVVDKSLIDVFTAAKFGISKSKVSKEICLALLKTYFQAKSADYCKQEVSTLITNLHQKICLWLSKMW